jgi:hypothetical protein
MGISQVSKQVLGMYHQCTLPPSIFGDCCSGSNLSLLLDLWGTSDGILRPHDLSSHLCHLPRCSLLIYEQCRWQPVQPVLLVVGGENALIRRIECDWWSGDLRIREQEGRQQ